MDSFERACHEADRKKQDKQDPTKAKANGGGTKPPLVVDPGELPTVAEKLRDIFARSGALFDRGVPVHIVKPADGGLPAAAVLTNYGVVRMSHQYCRPVKNGENA